jgi:hypothetical protein
MKKITILLILVNLNSYSQQTINFENDGLGADWNWVVDANGSNSPLEFISNPNPSTTNNTSVAAKLITSPNGDPWALTYTDDAGAITFTEQNSLVKMNVLKTVSTPVAIKFEDSNDPSFYAQIEVTNTIINGDWEELTFDFSTVIGNTYDRMVIIPDFLARSQPNETYFDQISFNSGGAIEDYNMEDIDFEDDGFGANWVWTVHNNHTNPAVEVVSNPNPSALNDTNNVAKFTSLADGAPWALTFTDNIGTFLLNNDTRIISLKVLKTVPTNFGIKLEYVDPTNNEVLYFNEIVSPTTVINGEWELLAFDFSSSVGTAYNRLVIIPDFEERSQTNVSYFDQISFGSTANLESFLVDNIDIFPNPAKNQFNLSSNLNNSLGIQIFDVLGKSVKKLDTNKKSINISDLNSGIYFVRIKNGDYYVTKKLIIN